MSLILPRGSRGYVGGAAPFTDNFNRADEELSLDADWDVLCRQGGLSSNKFDVISNQLVSSANNSQRSLYAGGGTWTGTVYAEMEYVAHSAGSFGMLTGPCIIDPVAATAYFGAVITTSATEGRFRIDLCTAYTSTAYTPAAGSTQSGIFTLTAGDVVRIEREIIDASTVEVRLYQNATLQRTYTDTRTARLDDDVRGGIANLGITSQTMTFDNFEAGQM